MYMHYPILKQKYTAAPGKMAAAKSEMSAARQCHRAVTVAEIAHNPKNNLRVWTYNV